MSEEKKSGLGRTLSDADVVTEHKKLGRRSSLVAIGAAAVGAAIVGVPGTAEACTDRDPNDPAGRGRGNGITDRDTGYGADPAGCGRNTGYAPRPSGYTDRDPNDPAGNGRGPRACSDSDGGPYGDPAGNGRHC